MEYIKSFLKEYKWYLVVLVVIHVFYNFIFHGTIDVPILIAEGIGTVIGVLLVSTFIAGLLKANPNQFMGVVLIFMGIFLYQDYKSLRKNEKDATPTGWSAQDDKDFIQGFIKSPKVALIKEPLKTRYAECMLQKFKQKYPYGIDKTISEKEIESMNAECYKNIIIENEDNSSKPTIWTPEVERLIYEQVYSHESLKAFPEKRRKDICDCYVAKAKDYYATHWPINQDSATMYFNVSLINCLRK